MTLSKEKFEHILAYAKQQQKLGVHHCNILPDDMVEIMEMAAVKRERRERDKQEPVISVIFKDGWPIPETVGIVAGSEKLPDGAHEFYAAPPAPPAPVVPGCLANAFIAAIEKEQNRLHDDDYLMDSRDCIDVIREELQRLNACRAAMLQSFGNSEQLEPVSQPYKLVGEVVAWDHPAKERSVDFRWLNYDVAPGTKLYAMGKE